MVLEYAQRQTEGRSSWISHCQRCDTSRLEVVAVLQKQAREFVMAHHYSGSFPAARQSVGLFEGGVLVGVAVFGVPAGPHVLRYWTRLPPEQGIELSRFVLLDRVGYNGAGFWRAPCACSALACPGCVA